MRCPNQHRTNLLQLGVIKPLVKQRSYLSSLTCRIISHRIFICACRPDARILPPPTSPLNLIYNGLEKPVPSKCAYSPVLDTEQDTSQHPLRARSSRHLRPRCHLSRQRRPERIRDHSRRTERRYRHSTIVVIIIIIIISVILIAAAPSAKGPGRDPIIPRRLRLLLHCSRKHFRSEGRGRPCRRRPCRIRGGLMCRQKNDSRSARKNAIAARNKTKHSQERGVN